MSRDVCWYRARGDDDDGSSSTEGDEKSARVACLLTHRHDHKFFCK